jgi:SAM-dependent methyltransferase
VPCVSTPTHRVRDAAESFGADAGRYDRTRPSYPEALVQAVVAAAPGRDVLDVGIGTGIAARQFRAAGCQVTGIDADERMAAFARRDGFEVDVATFEEWDAAGRTFDVVVAGQTWHWVDPVAGASAAAAVLRPGGRLALFWNAAQVAPELAAAFAAAHRPVMPGPLAEVWTRPVADAYGVMAAAAEDGVRRSGAFREPARWTFEWDHTYSRAEWLDQLPTGGGYVRLTPAQLEEVLAGVGAAIDEAAGVVPVHYTTVVVTAVRSIA